MDMDFTASVLCEFLFPECAIRDHAAVHTAYFGKPQLSFYVKDYITTDYHCRCSFL